MFDNIQEPVTGPHPAILREDAAETSEIRRAQDYHSHRYCRCFSS